jgi:hypothetical protein
MPNIRIALAISLSRHDVAGEGGNRAGDAAMRDDALPPAADHSKSERKPLSPAAQRALAEAEARRLAAAANAQPMAKEFQGPKGPEPTRYGDWEVGGRCIDF